MTPFDLHVMALTIIGEAASESDEGKAAVAWVIRNRLIKKQKGWGTSLAGVCLMPKQFSCWNDAYRKRLFEWFEMFDSPWYIQAEYIVKRVMSGMEPVDPTGGADHYFADYIDPPSWADESKFTVQIGRHKFYRLRG